MKKNKKFDLRASKGAQNVGDNSKVDDGGRSEFGESVEQLVDGELDQSLGGSEGCDRNHGEEGSREVHR